MIRIGANGQSTGSHGQPWAAEPGELAAQPAVGRRFRARVGAWPGGPGPREGTGVFAPVPKASSDKQ